MAGRLDLQGLESLLGGGSRGELSLDGGEANLQLGVLIEPLLSRRDLDFEMPHEELSRAEVSLQALSDGGSDLLVAQEDPAERQESLGESAIQRWRFSWPQSVSRSSMARGRSSAIAWRVVRSRARLIAT